MVRTKAAAAAVSRWGILPSLGPSCGQWSSRKAPCLSTSAVPPEQSTDRNESPLPRMTRNETSPSVLAPMMSGQARAAIAALSSDDRRPAEGLPAPPLLTSFEDIVSLASAKRDLQLKYGLERFVRLIRFEPGRIQLGLTEEAPTRFTTDLGARLRDWTGERWIISIDSEASAPTLFEMKTANKAQLLDDALSNPIVAAVMERFPGSEIVDIRDPSPSAPNEANPKDGPEVEPGPAEGSGD